MTRRAPQTSLLALAPLLLMLGCADDTSTTIDNGSLTGDGGAGTNGGPGGGGPGGGPGASGGSNAGSSNSGNNGPEIPVDEIGDPPDVDADPPVKTACEASAGALTYTVESAPTVWLDGAKAAYSMTHDDQCNPALDGIDNYAVPLYKKWGLVGGPGPFVDACEQNQAWDKVREAAEAGLEILNHSWTHVIEEGAVTGANAQKEITDAQAKMNEELAKIAATHTETGRKINKRADFYIFPFDEFRDAAAMSVLKQTHLGARAGFRDPFNGCPQSICGADARPPVNTADGVEQMCGATGCGAGEYPEFSDHHITFDVWPRTYSKYALFHPEDILTAYVWDAIERGGWAMREFHSVTGKDVTDLTQLPTDEGFGPIPAKLFDEHLKFLAHLWKANLLWTCNPTECIKYRHARQAFTASISGNTIRYSGSVDPKFATAISVVVSTSSDVGSLVATQNGEPVRTRKIGPSKFSVTADPTLGDVIIADACSDADPSEVDPTIINESSRPQPAASVCDIVNVVGTGSDGKMDDLTRNADLGENQYTLPNPSQADGRDGAWSGYGMQSYGIQEEGGNPYIHAVMQPSGWAGITLAFLGGNGAGACYDASAYCGVTFRIRGQASPALGANDFPASSSEAGANVIVSFVNATTQTAALGGDRAFALNEAGGHPGYAVTATSSWQTKVLSWDALTLHNTPYWCTAGCNVNDYRFDPTKMQAIDWSFAASSSGTRTVDLDDIALIPKGDARCSQTTP